MLRRISREDGQGLVEFAVVFPIFILLVFVVIDGGILMGRYGNINHSANEGARLLAVAGGGTQPLDVNEIKARVKDQAHGLLDSAGDCGSGPPEICFEWADGPDGEEAGDVGSTVKVTVKYNYPLITPLVTSIIGGFDIEACAVARLERPYFGASGGGSNTC